MRTANRKRSGSYNSFKSTHAFDYYRLEHGKRVRATAQRAKAAGVSNTVELAMAAAQQATMTKLGNVANLAKRAFTRVRSFFGR